MQSDLNGLARHLGRVLAFCGTATIVIAGVVWIVGRDATAPAARHLDAVIVLGVMGATQLVLWFGLTYWADLAEKQPQS